MTVPLIVQGIIIILLWVGAWGLIELMIDRMVKDNVIKRAISYAVLFGLGLLLYFIVAVFAYSSI